MHFLLGKLMPATTALAGMAALALWLSAGPPGEFIQRVPGADKAPTTLEAAQEPVELAGTLIRGNGKPADLPGAWPCFRGPRLDNVGREDVPLAREWPEGGPPKLWTLVMTEGYAAAAVLKGRIYIHDYDRAKGQEAIRCLSLADGEEIWRFVYRVKIKMNHGITRTVPAVTEKHLVALGPLCHVACLDAISGEKRWMIDLVREYGTKVPPWYAGQCPLIDGERAILAPGGPEVLMIAVECATGRVVWKTPNPDGWKMTHSSVMPMEFAGKRFYVYCAHRGVVGVSAEDGRVLWKTPEWRISIANVPTPVPLPGGRIFLTGGYNAGSVILRLTDKGGQIAVEVERRLKPKVLDSPQHTPILYQGHLYAVRSDGRLACADLDGKPLWDSAADKFGHGPYLIANGLIFVMDDDARMVLAEATPDGYRKLADAKILDGHDAWGPMALVGGRLIIRDMTRMVCLDVRAR